MVVLLTRDLLIQSSTSEAARPLSAPLKTVPNLAAALKAIGEPAVSAFFVDLQTPGLNPTEFIERWKESGTCVPTIVFAQHVEDQLLDLFRGEERLKVLTRGQYSFQLPGLIANCESTNATQRRE